MAKKTVDPRKPVDKKRPAVTPENTEKLKVAAGGYKKQAERINAPAGTKLAPAGTKMRADQDKYAKEKAGGNASSTNRDSRTSAIARKLEQEHTFNNKAYDRMSKQFNK